MQLHLTLFYCATGGKLKLCHIAISFDAIWNCTSRIFCSRGRCFPCVWFDEDYVAKDTLLTLYFTQYQRIL